jgi:hypothetical protein
MFVKDFLNAFFTKTLIQPTLGKLKNNVWGWNVETDEAGTFEDHMLELLFNMQGEKTKQLQDGISATYSSLSAAD